MIDNFCTVVGIWWWEWQAWCWWSTCKYLKNVCSKNNFLFLPYITLHNTKKIYFMKNGESCLAGSRVQSCLGYDFLGGETIWNLRQDPKRDWWDSRFNPTWKRQDPTWDTPGISGGIGGIPPYLFTWVQAARNNHSGLKR